MSGKDLVSDAVLREMAQTGGIFLSPKVPVPGREPILLCDLASALLDAREALRLALVSRDNMTAEERAKARACLPDPRADESNNQQEDAR